MIYLKSYSFDVFKCHLDIVFLFFVSYVYPIHKRRYQNINITMIYKNIEKYRACDILPISSTPTK